MHQTSFIRRRGHEFSLAVLTDGNVLSGLVRRIDRSVKAISVSNVAGLDKVEEALETA